jgi:biopolymer transport protein ExbD
MFLLIGAAFVIVVAVITHSITLELEKNASNQEVSKKSTPVSVSKTDQSNTKKAPTNYQGKRDEMLDALNGLESKNMYRDLYAGLSMQNNTLTIKVNDSWSYMSKDARIGFIKHIGTMWFGMCGARKLHINPDDFYIKINHDQSGRTVATWDSLWGPSIKD